MHGKSIMWGNSKPVQTINITTYINSMDPCVSQRQQDVEQVIHTQLYITFMVQNITDILKNSIINHLYT